MSPRFLKDELVVFIGHSADAQAEAEAVYGLESQFQEELRKHRLASTEGAPFTSVKCWEWTFDAEGTPGGQKTLVDPVIDTGHVAIFVFKERVGPVTRAELDDCRKHRAKKIPVYAIFPKKNPPDLSDEEAARQWLELLSYKRKLQADWTEPDSQALRP
ncbi:MAG: signal transduction protein, partial [Acidobacteriota bacterium]